MPSETPPSRVKKAWRRPGTAASSDEPSIMACRPCSSDASRREPGERVRSGCGDAEHLEHRAHAAAPGVGQPLQRAGDVGGRPRAWPSPSASAARVSMPRRLRKSPCVTGPCTRAPTILGGARQRLEVDMGGDVGLARRFQGIGEAVAGDRLEGVAGIAAQMAVVDDERRAVLVAHALGELHDLGIRPPFEHGADGAARTSGGSSTSKRGVGSAAAPNMQLAVRVDLDHALVPAGLALHHLVDRQHVEIFVGEDDAPGLRARRRCCRAR